MKKIMNCNDNMELVESFGDRAILRSGTVFSNYAKLLSREDVKMFCDIINSNDIFSKNGFYLVYDKKQPKNSNFVKLTYRGYEIANIKLLDYTIYCNTEERYWEIISGYVFNFILTNWRKFLAEHIREYKEQFNKTILLCQMDSSCYL